MVYNSFAYSAEVIFGSRWPANQLNLSFEKRVLGHLERKDAREKLFMEAISIIEAMAATNKETPERIFLLVEKIYSMALSKEEPKGKFLTTLSDEATSNRQVGPSSTWQFFVNALICLAFKKEEMEIVKEVFLHIPSADSIAFVNVRDTLRRRGIPVPLGSWPVWGLNSILSRFLRIEEISQLMDIRDSCVREKLIRIGNASKQLKTS